MLEKFSILLFDSSRLFRNVDNFLGILYPSFSILLSFLFRLKQISKFSGTSCFTHLLCLRGISLPFLRRTSVSRHRPKEDLTSTAEKIFWVSIPQLHRKGAEIAVTR